jgi:hypothetical protein
MPIKYDYDQEKNIVYAYPSGQMSLSDVSEYFNNLVEDPNVRSDFIEIANLEEVTGFEFSYSDTLQLPNLFAELKTKKNTWRNNIYREKRFPIWNGPHDVDNC